MKKKKLTIALSTVSVLALAAFLSINPSKGSMPFNSLQLGDIEALSGCEITNGKGEVQFACSGSDKCSTSKFGYTLTCDGTKN